MENEETLRIEYKAGVERLDASTVDIRTNHDAEIYDRRKFHRFRIDKESLPKICDGEVPTTLAEGMSFHYSPEKLIEYVNMRVKEKHKERKQRNRDYLSEKEIGGILERGRED